MAELGDYTTTLGTGRFRLNLDCVLDDELFEHLGSPQFAHRFREGYWWTRYSGEEYRPLYAADQDALNGLCRRLFPEYFSY
jgi:hypothetical protein